MAPALTFQQMIDRTISYLNGPMTNLPKFATITDIVVAGGVITTLNIEPADGANSHRGPAVLEVENGALIYAQDWDANTGDVVVPSWGNGFQGAPQATGSGSYDDKVIVNPAWPRHIVGQYLLDAINSMYPRLYGVKVQQLTSATLAERYEVANDVEEILSLKIEGFGTTAPRREIRRRTLQTKNTDNKRYISIAPIGISGRPIFLVYKVKPVLPTDFRDTSWTWSSSLLPDTASDVPCIRAALNLVQSPEMAKLQVYGVETSERSKYVQAGSANSASRRLQELFDKRMAEEQDALSFLNPMRPSRRYN